MSIAIAQSSLHHESLVFAFSQGLRLRCSRLTHHPDEPARANDMFDLSLVSYLAEAPEALLGGSGGALQRSHLVRACLDPEGDTVLVAVYMDLTAGASQVVVFEVLPASGDIRHLCTKTGIPVGG